MFVGLQHIKYFEVEEIKLEILFEIFLGSVKLSIHEVNIEYGSGESDVESREIIASLHPFLY